MIRLQKREPFWLTLIPAGDDGVAVRIFVMPISRGIRRRARRAGQDVIGVGADFDTIDGLVIEDAAEEISRELIRRGILDVPEADRAWEGILDAQGKTAPVTPDNVEMALADDAFFEAADRAYVLPSAIRDAEKNGSSVSPSGTGEAGTAGKGIARSPAAARKRGGARSAPTGKTPSKRKPAKTSGK